VRALAAAAAHARAVEQLAAGGLAHALRTPGATDDPAVVAALDFVRERVALLLAAARGLGLPAERAQLCQERLDAALPSESAQKLTRARAGALLDALADAERALGEARALSPGPTAAERLALRDAASERGVALEVEPRGASIDAGFAFEGGRAALTAAGQEGLDHIAALLRSHPHGPVVIEADRPSPGSLGARRAAALAAFLARVVAPARVQQQSAAGALRILLPAYGLPVIGDAPTTAE